MERLYIFATTAEGDPVLGKTDTTPYDCVIIEGQVWPKVAFCAGIGRIIVHPDVLPFFA